MIPKRIGKAPYFISTKIEPVDSFEHAKIYFLKILIKINNKKPNVITTTTVSLYIGSKKPDKDKKKVMILAGPVYQKKSA